MQKILKSERKIRFQDCDPFNHLNNAKYLEYFLNAREDQLLEHYDLSVFDHVKTFGKSWLVASNQISYLKPATVMETVVVESELIHYTNKQLLVEMKMWDKNEIELKAILWIKFLYIDINSKKISLHPDNFMNLFESVLMPFNGEFFEERCATIVKNIRALNKLSLP